MRQLSTTSCALVSSGAAWCWSSARAGAQPLRPLFSAGPAIFTSGVRQLVATGLADCALVNGDVFCVGQNLEDQLGNGTLSGASSTPVKVLNLDTPIRDIAGGYGVVCAVSGKGSLSCWGLNVNGQLGDGSTLNSGTLHPVIGLTSGVTAVVTGAAHTCALAYARVWCWGDNSNGQLGDGSMLASNAPRLVALSS